MKARVYISNKLQDGYASLEVRITVNKTRFQFFIPSLKIPIDYWDYSTQRAKVHRKYPHARSVNMLIENICIEMEMCVIDCFNEKVEKKEFVRRLREIIALRTGQSIKSSAINFKEAFSEFIDYKKGSTSKSTANTYIALGSILFGNTKNDGFEHFLGKKLSFDDFDSSLSAKFESYLVSRGNNNGGVKNNFVQLKTFLKWAGEKAKYCPKDLYKEISTDLKRHYLPFSLTEEEFNTLVSTDFHHEGNFFSTFEKVAPEIRNHYQTLHDLENTRNLIVFMIATAQRPSDVLSYGGNGLKWGHIKDDKGLLTWEVFQKKVTGTFVRIPLEGLALQSISRQMKFSYEGDYIFKPASIMQYGRYVRLLLKVLGFDRIVRDLEEKRNKNEIIEKPLYEYFTLKHCRSTASTFYDKVAGSSIASHFTGHTSDSMTKKHYIARREDEMRRAARELSGNINIPDLSEIRKKIG